MPSKVTADMLRPLTLSASETQMIIDEAERILTETLAASELFIANGRRLPTSHWKLVKTKESVSVYRARKQPSSKSRSKLKSKSERACTCKAMCESLCKSTCSASKAPETTDAKTSLSSSAATSGASVFTARGLTSTSSSSSGSVGSNIGSSSNSSRSGSSSSRSDGRSSRSGNSSGRGSDNGGDTLDSRHRHHGHHGNDHDHDHDHDHGHHDHHHGHRQQTTTTRARADTIERTQRVASAASSECSSSSSSICSGSSRASRSGVDSFYDTADIGSSNSSGGGGKPVMGGTITIDGAFTTNDNSTYATNDCTDAAVRERITREINRSKPAERPLVVATGVVPGRVEDVAFGALAHTERLWRHRDAHMEDEFADVKILATITRPTVADPFRSLVVKWSTRSVGPLARMRDCVYIEANGVATDARGERVAFNLAHSLDCIARIPSFKHLDVVRANMSMCYISRQHDRSAIEVFCRGFADPGGVFADSIANAVFTDMVLSVVHVVDCAYIKKLLWLAHTKREQAVQKARELEHADKELRYLQLRPDELEDQQSEIAILGSDDESAARGCGKTCANCAVRLSSLRSLLQSPAQCRACRRTICHKCCVDKHLAVEASSGKMLLKSVPFCLHCVVEATQAPARDAAIWMLQAERHPWQIRVAEFAM